VNGQGPAVYLPRRLTFAPTEKEGAGNRVGSRPVEGDQ